METLDTSIPLKAVGAQFQPMQFPNPIQGYAQAQQLQVGAQQQQLNTYKILEAQHEQQTMVGLQDMWKKYQGADLTDPATQRQISGDAATIDPKSGMAYVKSFAEQNTAMVNLKKTNLELQKARLELTAHRIEHSYDETSYQANVALSRAQYGDDAVAGLPEHFDPEHMFTLKQLNDKALEHVKAQEKANIAVEQTRQEEGIKQPGRLAVAEVGKAETARHNRAMEAGQKSQLPTQASLAWEASGHDPQKAMELLQKLKPGMSIQMGENGELVSVETGAGVGQPQAGGGVTLTPAQKGKIFDEYRNQGEMLGSIGDVEQLLKENPNAATLTGKGVAMAENLRENVVALLGQRALTPEVQAKLDELRTMDASKLSTMHTILTFEHALMLHKGGRLNMQAVEEAEKSLGGKVVLPGPADILARTGVLKAKLQRGRSENAKILWGDQAPPEEGGQAGGGSGSVGGFTIKGVREK